MPSAGNAAVNPEEEAEGQGTIAYAHSKENVSPGLWHRLDQHLVDVGDLAREFASPWGAGDLAYVAGAWHDIGKYAPDWQEFLREPKRTLRPRMPIPTTGTERGVGGPITARLAQCTCWQP